jgi:hypothetical protein
MTHRPFNVCEVCGKPKTRWISHAKCSRELQAKYGGRPSKQTAAKKGRTALPEESIEFLSKTGRTSDA